MDSVLSPSGDPFDLAGRLGLAGVEVTLTRDELRSARQERVRELQRRSRETGVAIPSLVLADHNRGGLAHGDPTVAEAAAEDVRQAIRWATALAADAAYVTRLRQRDGATAADLLRLPR